ncbi:MAG: filamentous hemagglutinin N-terminal domain-containing protein [Proteobacteria bacterium]|nr:filamentous hemagglutinin N-terminal domain-containing protein [Pseudomonadota bacterium]
MGRTLGIGHRRAASHRHRSRVGALWRSGAVLLALAAAGAAPVQAQITLDGSLGRSGGLSGPDYLIGAELGRQVGGNLFHSFGRFNLLTGESATFSGPGNVNNIIGRVTGGSVSSIDGTIRSTIPGANLFLVNPAGMMFGPNASLDVQGSFHASTADYIRFADGARFQATNPGGSTFTAAAPAAFGFLGPNPAAITVSGSQLTLNNGRNLSFVSGDLRLDGAKLSTPAGGISLVATAGNGEVAVPGVDGVASTVGRYGDITIVNGSTIDASGFLAAENGESISIRAGNVAMVGQTRIVAEHGFHGKITIDADQSVTLLALATDDSVSILSEASGDITIRTGNFAMLGRTQIETSSSFVTSGHISIIATGDVRIDAAGAPSFGIIESVAGPFGGSGGVDISGQSITLLRGAHIGAPGFDYGAGDIILHAAGAIVIDGSGIEADGVGRTSGGSISINANAVTISNGGFVTSTALANRRGAGTGGNITIVASGPITVTGAKSSIAAQSLGTNAAGNITIQGDTVTVRNGGSISTSAALGADMIPVPLVQTGGGNIQVDARSLLYLHGGAITTSVEKGAGNGGKITVDNGFGSATPAIVLKDGQISATAVGGSGGKVQLRSDVFIASPGSQIDVSSVRGAQGTILIEAPNVDVASSVAASAPDYFDASALIQEGCAARAGQVRSSLVALGRGTLPVDAEGSISALYRANDTRAATAGPATGRNGMIAETSTLPFNGRSLASLVACGSAPVNTLR